MQNLARRGRQGGSGQPQAQGQNGQSGVASAAPPTVTFVDPTQMDRSVFELPMQKGDGVVANNGIPPAALRGSATGAPQIPHPFQRTTKSPPPSDDPDPETPLLGGWQPRRRLGARARGGSGGGPEPGWIREAAIPARPRPSSEFVRMSDWKAGDWMVDRDMMAGSHGSYDGEINEMGGALSKSWAAGTLGAALGAAVGAAEKDREASRVPATLAEPIPIAPKVQAIPSPLSPITGPRRSSSSFRLDIDELWRVAAASARPPPPASPGSPTRPGSPFLVALAALRALDAENDGTGRRVPSLGRTGRGRDWDRWDSGPSSPAPLGRGGMRESPSMWSVRSASLRIRSQSTPPRNRQPSGASGTARSASPPPRPSDDLDLGIDPDLARAVFAVAAGGKLAATGWGDPSPKRGMSGGAPGISRGKLNLSSSSLAAVAASTWSGAMSPVSPASPVLPPRNASFWGSSLLPTRAPYLAPPPPRSPPPALSSPTPPSPPSRNHGGNATTGMIPSPSTVSVAFPKARPSVGWKVAGSVIGTMVGSASGKVALGGYLSSATDGTDTESGTEGEYRPSGVGTDSWGKENKNSDPTLMARERARVSPDAVVEAWKETARRANGRFNVHNIDVETQIPPEEHGAKDDERSQSITVRPHSEVSETWSTPMETTVRDSWSQKSEGMPLDESTATRINENDNCGVHSDGALDFEQSYSPVKEVALASDLQDENYESSVGPMTLKNQTDLQPAIEEVRNDNEPSAKVPFDPAYSVPPDNFFSESSELGHVESENIVRTITCDVEKNVASAKLRTPASDTLNVHNLFPRHPNCTTPWN
ncbi:hypothetical protein M427DRAFT_284471 [Gonapodya prolifera JEL478]|uniref:Uncharacterized protein n=1 Tax=Gonapodya prolifera (strain JEL478) TaxID=1344416 RepID=A0A139AJQ3_GONPJ|nr:hypothetical protein M427DRAFT_284471 [Gonapodya prolifera JEL478]|eukprot:KXS16784.1 hypothetical protein M427DRAFT_284471 [Gonapodya prolifera JEL478]